MNAISVAVELHLVPGGDLRRVLEPHRVMGGLIERNAMPHSASTGAPLIGHRQIRYLHFALCRIRLPCESQYEVKKHFR